MTELREAAKAALTIKHKGREYRLQPLELDDLAEAEQHVSAIPFERARRQMEALGDQLTDEARKMILDIATKAAEQCSITSAAFMRFISSVEGTAYLMWLSLRRSHPDITREAAASLIDLANLDEWQKLLDKVSGLTAETGSPNPTQSPAPPDQQTGGASSE